MQGAAPSISLRNSHARHQGRSATSNGKVTSNGKWLDDMFGLADVSIVAHLLCQWWRGGAVSGGRLDLAAPSGPMTLMPTALSGLRSMAAQMVCCCVADNRAHFKQATAALLGWVPAPTELVCGADPAGILIAQQAAVVFTDTGDVIVAATPQHLPKPSA
jgi:hypothetical protein